MLSDVSMMLSSLSRQSDCFSRGWLGISEKRPDGKYKLDWTLDWTGLFFLSCFSFFSKGGGGGGWDGGGSLLLSFWNYRTPYGNCKFLGFQLDLN